MSILSVGQPTCSRHCSRCGKLDDSPTSIMMVREFSAHHIGVGGAVGEADLVDILGRLDQRADVIFQDNRKRAWFAVAHGLAGLKVTALDARRRLLSAS